MSKSTEELRRQWLGLLKPFSVPQALAEKTFEHLVAAYSEPGRFYHTLSHIENVLTSIDRLTGDAPHPALQFAAWFHDAVYDTHAKDNEEQSAALARTMLPQLNIPADIVAATERLILLTKSHVPESGDVEGKVLVDADLAILGATPNEYEEYARAIRREYAWVPEVQYRARRSRILADFLKRPRIYYTPVMFEACEQAARKNVATEIARLTSS
jgi:predicted metal-dependent HD superfamily phosphohydrolase